MVPNRLGVLGIQFGFAALLRQALLIMIDFLLELLRRDVLLVILCEMLQGLLQNFGPIFFADLPRLLVVNPE